ncbi:C-type lectin domain family 14 member A [Embiotoca jacksoni]|uniref:C-type lectin domain family 14 member A n=1 Tax=Embiotoca jacksoni TaxID=100190 RepID=UPI0037039962
MELRLCCCWIVVFLLRNVSSSPPQYNLHRTRTAFDQAIKDCSPGVLTTVTTKQEVEDILKLVSNSVPPLDDFTLWVGLKKVKNECVDLSLPLKGFRWTDGSGQELQVVNWAEEPTLTCTAVLCAALKVQFDGSTVTGWGLIPVTCKSQYQFICKLKDGVTGGSPEGKNTPVTRATPEPTTIEPKSATPEPSGPAPPETRPAPLKPESVTPQPKLLTPGPDIELKPNPGPRPGSGPVSGLDLCHNPSIEGERSISLDPDNSNRIRVECWSSVQLDLTCSGRPGMWRTLDGSPANFSAVCLPCANGFRKDTSGHCMDVDECGAGDPCRHTCLNTEGSYRCVCYDVNGKQHDENSWTCKDTVKIDGSGSVSAILIPVLVAVAALVILLVIVGVTVKCCLMKRSKKHATKETEKIAMKSKNDRDSFETANETAAT